MGKRSKLKRKMKWRLSEAHLRDMMENKLKPQTIPSKKLYNRNKKSDDLPK